MQWTYVIRDCNGEEIIGIFYEKEFQKEIRKSLKLKEKNEKAINYMLSRKRMVTLWTVGLIKKI